MNTNTNRHAMIPCEISSSGACTWIPGPQLMVTELQDMTWSAELGHTGRTMTVIDLTLVPALLFISYALGFELPPLPASAAGNWAVSPCLPNNDGQKPSNYELIQPFCSFTLLLSETLVIPKKKKTNMHSNDIYNSRGEKYLQKMA